MNSNPLLIPPMSEVVLKKDKTKKLGKTKTKAPSLESVSLFKEELKSSNKQSEAPPTAKDSELLRRLVSVPKLSLNELQASLKSPGSAPEELEVDSTPNNVYDPPCAVLDNGEFTYEPIEHVPIEEVSYPDLVMPLLETKSFEEPKNYVEPNIDVSEEELADDLKAREKLVSMLSSEPQKQMLNFVAEDRILYDNPAESIGMSTIHDIVQQSVDAQTRFKNEHRILPSYFYNLVYKFCIARVAFDNECVSLKVKTAECQELLRNSFVMSRRWIEDTQICGEGERVLLRHDYETVDMNPEKFFQLEAQLRSLATRRTDELSTLFFKSGHASVSIDMFLYEFLSSRGFVDVRGIGIFNAENELPRYAEQTACKLRGFINVLFQFEKSYKVDNPESTFLLSTLHKWMKLLVFKLLEIADDFDYQFILQHTMHCPGTSQWAKFVQFPTLAEKWTISSRNEFLSLLTTLLTPVSVETHSHKEFKGDSVTLKLGPADSSILLPYQDYIDILTQLPFRPFVQSVVGLDDCTPTIQRLLGILEMGIYDFGHHSEYKVLISFLGHTVTSIVWMLDSVDTELLFSAFELLVRNINHVGEAISELPFLHISEYTASQVFRTVFFGFSDISKEYINSPYYSIPISHSSWRMETSLSDTTSWSGLFVDEDGSPSHSFTYWLQLIVGLATSKFQDLALVITEELFNLCFVDSKTSPVMAVLCSELFGKICAAHQCLISFLLVSTYSKFVHVGEHSLALFVNIALNEWLPTLDDFAILRQFLLTSADSSQSKTAIHIVSHLASTSNPDNAKLYSQIMLLVAEVRFVHVLKLSRVGFWAGLIGEFTPVALDVWKDILLAMNLRHPDKSLIFDPIDLDLRTFINTTVQTHDPQLQDENREFLDQARYDPIVCFVILELTQTGNNLAMFESNGYTLFRHMLSTDTGILLAFRATSDLLPGWLLQGEGGPAIVCVPILRDILDPNAAKLWFDILGAVGGAVGASIVVDKHREPLINTSGIIQQTCELVNGHVLLVLNGKLPLHVLTFWLSEVVASASGSKTLLRKLWYKNEACCSILNSIIGNIISEKPSLMCVVSDFLRVELKSTYKDSCTPMWSYWEKYGHFQKFPWLVLAMLLEYMRADRENWLNLGRIMCVEFYGRSVEWIGTSSGLKRFGSRRSSYLEHNLLVRLGQAVMLVERTHPVCILLFQAFLYQLFSSMKTGKGIRVHFGHLFFTESRLPMLIAIRQRLLQVAYGDVIPAMCKWLEFVISTKSMDWVSHPSTYTSELCPEHLIRIINFDLRGSRHFLCYEILNGLEPSGSQSVGLPALPITDIRADRIEMAKRKCSQFIWLCEDSRAGLDIEEILLMPYNELFKSIDAMLDPLLNAIDLYQERKLRHQELDNAFLDLVPQLWRNENSESMYTSPCKRGSKCSRHAVYKFRHIAATVDLSVEDRIQQNRVIVDSCGEPSADVTVYIISLIVAIERAVKRAVESEESEEILLSWLIKLSELEGERMNSFVCSRYILDSVLRLISTRNHRLSFESQCCILGCLQQHPNLVDVLYPTIQPTRSTIVPLFEKAFTNNSNCHILDSPALFARFDFFKFEFHPHESELLFRLLANITLSRQSNITRDSVCEVMQHVLSQNLGNSFLELILFLTKTDVSAEFWTFMSTLPLHSLSLDQLLTSYRILSGFMQNAVLVSIFSTFELDAFIDFFKHLVESTVAIILQTRSLEGDQCHVVSRSDDIWETCMSVYGPIIFNAGLARNPQKLSAQLNTIVFLLSEIDSDVLNRLWTSIYTARLSSATLESIMPTLQGLKWADSNFSINPREMLDFLPTTGSSIVVFEFIGFVVGSAPWKTEGASDDYLLDLVILYVRLLAGLRADQSMLSRSLLETRKEFGGILLTLSSYNSLLSKSSKLLLGSDAGASALEDVLLELAGDSTRKLECFSEWMVSLISCPSTSSTIVDISTWVHIAIAVVDKLDSIGFGVIGVLSYFTGLLNYGDVKQYSRLFDRIKNSTLCCEATSAVCRSVFEMSMFVQYVELFTEQALRVGCGWEEVSTYVEVPEMDPGRFVKYALKHGCMIALTCYLYQGADGCPWISAWTLNPEQEYKLVGFWSKLIASFDSRLIIDALDGTGISKVMSILGMAGVSSKSLLANKAVRAILAGHKEDLVVQFPKLEREAALATMAVGRASEEPLTGINSILSIQKLYLDLYPEGEHLV